MIGGLLGGKARQIQKAMAALSDIQQSAVKDTADRISSFSNIPTKELIKRFNDGARAVYAASDDEEQSVALFEVSAVSLALSLRLRN